MRDAPAVVDRERADRTVAQWFDDHVATIHRYVARRIGEEDAWDVTAETFRIALELFERFDADGRSDQPERAWLYGIASNLLRRHWRTEERRLRALARSAGGRGAVVGDPLLEIDARLDAVREYEHVVAAIATLEVADRELLTLLVWESLSSSEAAAALGIAPGTVRSRLHRIRTHLRDQGASQ